VSDGKAFAGLLARFGLTGVVCTAVSFAVIATLDAGLKVSPALANTAGYLVGIPLGFALSRAFVFRHEGAMGVAGAKYLTSVALGFTLNQLVLRAAGQLLGAGAGPHLAAQLTGMAAYTVTTFMLGRFWVFRT
jgi:putative flippase GtrA